MAPGMACREDSRSPPLPHLSALTLCLMFAPPPSWARSIFSLLFCSLFAGQDIVDGGLAFGWQTLIRTHPQLDLQLVGAAVLTGTIDGGGRPVFNVHQVP